MRMSYEDEIKRAAQGGGTYAPMYPDWSPDDFSPESFTQYGGATSQPQFNIGNPREVLANSGSGQVAGKKPFAGYSGNSNIANAFRIRRDAQAARASGGSKGQMTQGGQQMPPQASGMAQQMGDLIKDPANLGGQIAGATGAIGATLNANADRQNELANTQATEEGKTRRLSMLMGMMGPLLGGGGGGYGGGGFMTNFGQAAIPASMFGGMGGGGGGGGYGMAGNGAAGTGDDFNYAGGEMARAQAQQDFMRQNMLKTLGGMRYTMNADPKSLAPTNFQFGQY